MRMQGEGPVKLGGGGDRAPWLLGEAGKADQGGEGQ